VEHTNLESDLMVARKRYVLLSVDTLPTSCLFCNEEDFSMTWKNHEKFKTLSKAANELGIPVYTLRRAVKIGLVPAYNGLSGRTLVRLSEVEAAIVNSSNKELTNV
jgi:hypothetical protein